MSDETGHGRGRAWWIDRVGEEPVNYHGIWAEEAGVVDVARRMLQRFHQERSTAEVKGCFRA
jgi:hypothetical protein